ncbi:MAG TPA: hypothetical protein VNA28_16845 [Solirubrobacteraceae bacterium]|nr:hypothetical protein [Solirubrobacteraceae bacterium]
MRNTIKKTVAGVAALAAVGLGGAAYVQASADDDDASVTGPQADAATAAALAITKGGKANSVERDSENGAVWEVEVTKPDGSTVDVRLSKSYERVAVEGDTEAEDGDENEADERDDNDDNDADEADDRDDDRDDGPNDDDDDSDDEPNEVD